MGRDQHHNVGEFLRAIWATGDDSYICFVRLGLLWADFGEAHWGPGVALHAAEAANLSFSANDLSGMTPSSLPENALGLGKTSWSVLDELRSASPRPLAPFGNVKWTLCLGKQ